MPKKRKDAPVEESESEEEESEEEEEQQPEQGTPSSAADDAAPPTAAGSAAAADAAASSSGESSSDEEEEEEDDDASAAPASASASASTSAASASASASAIPAAPEGEGSGRKVYISGLPRTMYREAVKKYVEEQTEAPVVDVSLSLFPDSKKSRGMAFVTFKTSEGAAEAIEKLNGATLEGRWLKVEPCLQRDNPALAKADAEGGAGGSGGKGGRGGGSNVCFAFQNNDCSRGDACRFSHTAPHDDGCLRAVNDSRSSGGWGMGKQTGKSTVCFHFQKGNCKHGDECKFDHVKGAVYSHPSFRQAEEKKSKACYRCGSFKHQSEHCKAQRICYRCKSKEHLSSQCPKRQKQQKAAE